VIAMTAGVLASERERSMRPALPTSSQAVVVEEMMEVINRLCPSGRGAAGAAPPADEEVFTMAPLMRVMGRDAGRGVLRRMVEDALNKGMTPVRDAETALQAGRHSEVARILHGLRGSVGTLGTKRLIRAAFATAKPSTRAATTRCRRCCRGRGGAGTGAGRGARMAVQAGGLGLQRKAGQTRPGLTRSLLWV
jgi:hypothetical protein